MFLNINSKGQRKTYKGFSLAPKDWGHIYSQAASNLGRIAAVFDTH